MPPVTDPEEEALDLLITRAFLSCSNAHERAEISEAADVVRSAYVLRQQTLPRRER